MFNNNRSNVHCDLDNFIYGDLQLFVNNEMLEDKFYVDFNSKHELILCIWINKNILFWIKDMS